MDSTKFYCGYTRINRFYVTAKVGLPRELGITKHRNTTCLKGLATEAVKVLLNYAYKELTLNRIEATCYIENIGSERVMQKVGMTYEGVLREATFAKGKFHDLKVYSILAKEHYRNEEEEM
jgi:ribosomal-protein-alanine N-acetyltransferase